MLVEVLPRPIPDILAANRAGREADVPGDGVPVEREVRPREVGALAGEGVLDQPGVELLVTTVEACEVVLSGEQDQSQRSRLRDARQPKQFGEFGDRLGGRIECGREAPESVVADDQVTALVQQFARALLRRAQQKPRDGLTRQRGGLTDQRVLRVCDANVDPARASGSWGHERDTAGLCCPDSVHTDRDARLWLHRVAAVTSRYEEVQRARSGSQARRVRSLSCSSGSTNLQTSSSSARHVCGSGRW
jgi:hypothetical protein